MRARPDLGQNKETTARMASHLHSYQEKRPRPGATNRFGEQKMYSQVAFGLPLITSREYSNNLTQPERSLQGMTRDFSVVGQFQVRTNATGCFGW